MCTMYLYYNTTLLHYIIRHIYSLGGVCGLFGPDPCMLFGRGSGGSRTVSGRAI